MFHSNIARWWLIGLLVSLVLVPISLRWLDVPIAIFCAGFSHGLGRVGSHLGSPVLVTGEALVATFLASYRIFRGQLPELGKITVIGCATSLCVFALNDVVLKTIFGMPTPSDMLLGAPHAFHFFAGSSSSSFPSGHMVLATGFVATFVKQQRWVFLLLTSGLLVAAALLILGGWHFLSDVIAGACVGGTAGLLAAILWEQDRLRLRA